MRIFFCLFCPQSLFINLKERFAIVESFFADVGGGGGGVVGGVVGGGGGGGGAAAGGLRCRIVLS